MSDATGNRLDACELLAGTEARLIHLAALITQRGQDITEDATGTDNPNIPTTSAARAAGQRQA